MKIIDLQRGIAFQKDSKDSKFYNQLKKILDLSSVTYFDPCCSVAGAAAQPTRVNPSTDALETFNGTAWVEVVSTGSTGVGLEARLSLSSAQILDLYTTPQIIVANPGVGKYVLVLSASCEYTFVSVAYATNTGVGLFCEGANNDNSQASNSFLSSAISEIRRFNFTGGNIGQGQILTDVPLIVKARNSGNPTTGDGTLIVNLVYVIVTI